MHDDELADIETRIAEHEEFMRYQIDRRYQSKRYSAKGKEGCELDAHSEIHVIPSRQPLIKYHQPGDCACGQTAIRKCKHCDLPLCQRCAYLSDEGILCSEHVGEMEYEAALILIGGRADAR